MTPHSTRPHTRCFAGALRASLLVRLGLVAAALMAGACRSASAAEYQDYFITDPCAEQRAGYPQRVGVLASRSNTKNYGGYYVGGGNVGLAGGPRNIEDGTWGWDYGGLFKNNWVRLGWNDGSRKQGGVGSYKSSFESPFHKHSKHESHSSHSSESH